jgi:ubiquinone/menaquinone biosynthesis C-methylase UbiE
MANKISAQAYFDELAPEYEYEGVESALQTNHLVEAKKIFNKYQIIQGSILDLACGTGLLSQVVEGDFQFTGIDISENMLQSAAQRGYRTIHKPLETALSEIPAQSYDFVVCLTALLCIQDIQGILAGMCRIARQGILLTLEEISPEFLEEFPAPAYSHTHLSFPAAKEDYRLFGWQTPKGLDMYIRMIYLSPPHNMRKPT